MLLRHSDGVSSEKQFAFELQPGSKPMDDPDPLSVSMTAVTCFSPFSMMT